MLNLKKAVVAVLAFSSSVVFAGAMGPVCSAINTTVPCETQAWEFGAKALYLNPDINSTAKFPIADQTDGHTPRYEWGFQIEGSYYFNTGNDLNLNWYHVSQSNRRTFGSEPAEIFTFGANISSITPVSGISTIEPKWDAINLELGQHVDFGNNKSIRFHGGAQFARVTNDVNKSSIDEISEIIGGVDILVDSLYSHETSYNPTYNGFGPRIGADMAYKWDNGLGIYANGATGILAGTSAWKTTFIDSEGNDINGSSSRTAIVPVIDTKLGATYNYAMAQGYLTLDAGWMWVNYFNAHEQVDGTRTDVGLQGPFFGLKWLGSVA